MIASLHVNFMIPRKYDYSVENPSFLREILTVIDMVIAIYFSHRQQLKYLVKLIKSVAFDTPVRN